MRSYLTILFKRNLQFCVAMVFLAYVFMVPTVQAKDIIISDGEVVTEQQSLGHNNTLVIELGGQLESDQSDIGIVWAYGDNVTVTNYGTIFSKGKTIPDLDCGQFVEPKIPLVGCSPAISLFGKNGTIINEGSLIGTEFGDYGIYANNDSLNATIINNGVISTMGDYGRGIHSAGHNAQITNSGTIDTLGFSAFGIYSRGDLANIIHSGTVTVTGEDAIGILFTGEGSSLTVNGSISATGAATHAIQGDIEIIIGGETNFFANNQTLNILSGAEILGRIDLGALGSNNDVVNVMTDSRMASMTLTFENTETINLLTGDIPAVRNGETVVILDPTGIAGDRAVLGATTSQVHRLVLQQLADKEEGWLRIFANSSDRDDDGLANAWDQSVNGVVGGYDMRLSGGQRIGLFAGYSHGQVETSGVSSINNTSDNLFFGAYGQHDMDKLTFRGSLVAGFADHDSERTLLDNLEGIERADGDYGSFYISPSLAVGMSYDLGDGVELRPSARMAYTFSSFDSYTESGTTSSNVSFDVRNFGIVDGRLQLAVARSFFEDRAEVELRTGGTLTHYGKKSVDVSLADGESLSYKVPGENTVSGGYTGVSVRHAFSDRFKLAGDFEYGWAGGLTTQSLSGHLGLVYNF